MGRPSDYTKETADRIVERLIEGESLRRICKDDDMPGAATVMRWLIAQPEFREQYTRAREAQADSLFEESLEIADDGSQDYKVKLGDDGPEITLDSEHIQRSRLRVDVRKWMAGKLRPKVYGDKVVNEHSGPDGGDIPVGINVRFVGTPKA